MTEPTEGLVLDHARHLRYWLRNFKTFLPTAYTSTDSNRMYLAFMILTSLDILGVLHSEKIKEDERKDAIEWVYHCQHPDGGFRAFPGTDFGKERRNSKNKFWDPPNAAGTFFALLSLIILRDDLSRIDRRACLSWLRKLQAPDGSFGEILGTDERPYGARDVRQSFFAIGTRYILGLPDGDPQKDDIDREAAIQYICATQTIDGGIGQEPGAEAHGGLAYCACSSLILLGDIVRDAQRNLVSSSQGQFLKDLSQWLVSRQVYYEETEESDDEGSTEQPATEIGTSTTLQDQDGVDPDEADQWTGFAGRPNKPADTCYTFWVGCTIILLGLDDMIDKSAHRRFLLEKTEHRFGGFGKVPGDLPDIMHSALGLVALSLLGQPGLREVDPTFAMTREARRHLDGIRCHDRSNE